MRLRVFPEPRLSEGRLTRFVLRRFHERRWVALGAPVARSLALSRERHRERGPHGSLEVQSGHVPSRTRPPARARTVGLYGLRSAAKRVNSRPAPFAPSNFLRRRRLASVATSVARHQRSDEDTTSRTSVLRQTYHSRPRISRDHPPNLSILVSGGKETNQDSPSNGE